MIFTDEGHTFAIEFQYAATTPGARTTCKIYVLDDKGKPQGGALAKGEAWCSAEDKFVKETGRKIALERAIRPFPREKRTVIWKAYHGRKQH